MVSSSISSTNGVGVVDEMALERPPPAAVIALAQARCSVAEFFPAGMRQLDPGAPVLCREADLDQLFLLGRQLDNPGKGETVRRGIKQHGSPGRFAPLCGSLKNTTPAPRLPRNSHPAGA